MYTKKLIPVLLLGSGLLISACGGGGQNAGAPAEAPETGSAETAEAKFVTVDLGQSQVKWKGEMLGMYSHEGTVALKEAKLELKGQEIVSGSFVADLTRIVPTDENYNVAEDKTPEKLVGHLSSPDFFDVSNHPTASFVIKEVTGNTVTGTFTVRGKTGEETITGVVISESEGKITLAGKLTFNRQNYDVAFKMPVKDMVLSDDIALDITLVANL